MSEKRKYTRYACKIKTTFDYYEGNPDEVDIIQDVPSKGKGLILDLSQGGVFIVSDNRVPVHMPIRVFFSIKKEEYEIMGRIVRTGLLEFNPTEVAQKFARFAAQGEVYIAVEFDEEIPEIPEKDI